MEALISLVLLLPAAAGVEVLKEISWASPENHVKGAQTSAYQEDVSATMLKVVDGDSQPTTVRLGEIRNPKISKTAYALVGRIRHEGVTANSCLEMWSFFPEGGRYFSRTLAAYGPMRHLGGDSNWRNVMVPFSLQGSKERPERLEMNLVLAGSGTVWLGPFRLVQYDAGENPLTEAGQWWGGRTAGLIGACIGLIGGLAGTVIGILSSRRTSRRAVMTTMTSVLALGICLLGAGIAAILLKQPYAVWYPLLLGGAIFTVVMGAMLPVMRRRFADRELRRMQAEDVPT